MTQKQFNTKANKLFLSKGFKMVDYRYQLETKFGTHSINSEWIPKIKVAHIHSQLKGDAQHFKDVTGYRINTYNGKLNFYFEEPKNCLNELEEYLDNLTFINN